MGRGPLELAQRRLVPALILRRLPVAATGGLSLRPGTQQRSANFALRAALRQPSGEPKRLRADGARSFFMPLELSKNFALFCGPARDRLAQFLGLALLAAGPCPAQAIDANRADATQADASQEGQPVSETPASFTAAGEATPPAAPAEVAFEPARRAVSNWLTEAMDNLDLSRETKTEIAGGPGLLDLPRCVKLNNYWCIKRAGWAGEIAADAEGHVAFASAIDGAIAAAILLRRYYIDYNRRSALAILSHWAPAQCAVVTAAMGRPSKPRAVYIAILASVAPHGIQNTLRAHWLAAHRQGFFRPDKTKALRRSIVPNRLLVMMRAPEIAVGMGEAQRAPIPITKIAALDFTAPVTEPPGTACASENTRIQNYAARAIDGIAASPNDDLNLFLADGTAGANLSRLLENMAKVEIGPLATHAGLIAAAIDRLTPRSLAAGTPSFGDSHAVGTRPRE